MREGVEGGEDGGHGLGCRGKRCECSLEIETTMGMRLGGLDQSDEGPRRRTLTRWWMLNVGYLILPPQQPSACNPYVGGCEGGDK